MLNDMDRWQAMDHLTVLRQRLTGLGFTPGDFLEIAIRADLTTAAQAAYVEYAKERMTSETL